MLRNHNLVYLDSSLRHYVEANNEKFKRNISSVFMTRDQLSNFYHDMICSIPAAATNQQGQSTPNTMLAVGKSNSLASSPKKKLPMKGNGLNYGSTGAQKEDKSKSKSVFCCITNSNSGVLQQWSKAPQQQMNKKPLISGIGENSTGAQEDKKNAQNESVTSKGILGIQNMKERRNLRLSSKFSNTLKQRILRGSKHKTVAAPSVKVVKPPQSKQGKKQLNADKLLLQNKKFIQPKNAEKSQQKDPVGGMERRDRKYGRKSIQSSINPSPRPLESGKTIDNVIQLLVDMLYETKIYMKQSEDSNELLESQKDMKNDLCTSIQNNKRNIGHSQASSQRLDRQSIQEERQARKVEIYDKFFRMVVLDKNKEIERVKNKRYNKEDGVSDEPDIEEFYKFKQEEEEKYIKKYRLKERKPNKSAKVKKESEDEEYSLYEQQNEDRNRRRKLNELFKEFVSKMPDKKYLKDQEKESICIEHERKEQLFQKIKDYFYRKNRYSPSD